MKTFSKKEPHEAANAFYSIANIYEKNNDTKNFVPHLESYLRLDGDGEWAARAREFLRRI